MSCRHPDIRRFDEVRCCLACGEAVFESLSSAATDQIAGTPYQYRRLNYTLGQEIRLIELLPGLPSDDIRCNIIHVNLDDDPKFEAVSYTWATKNGDDTFSKTIYTSSNTTMSVTANCMSALRQLRKISNVRRLWVDAVCIDQTNPSERNHQVAMMTQIYTQAVNVRICIDDMRRSANYGPLFDWLQSSRDPETEPRFPNLRHLISLRYFQRVWVIQEVALARVAYLHVNDRKVLFSSAILRYIQSKHPTRGVLSWDTSFKVKADLLACLRAGISGQCTDPKDKVYAVLGMMEPIARSLIPIDYSLRVEDLYAYVVIAIIKVYKKMELLRYMNQGFQVGVEGLSKILEICQNGTANQVCDQFSGNFIRPWSSEMVIYELSSSIPITVTESSVTATVTTNGPVIDTYIGGPLPSLQVRGHLIDIVSQTEEDDFRGDEWMAAFFEPGSNESGSLSWNEVRQRTSIEDLQTFQRILSREKIAPRGEGFVVGDGFVKLFRTFYSVGFCRIQLRPSDIIFAVDGVRAPLVLRIHDHNSSLYRVIGDCYLWAALELDYWYPGSKKGIWSRRPSNLGRKQTCMIEIC